LKPDDDVPSPVDFHDPAQARAWEEQTIKTRPWRPQFFAAMADALRAYFVEPACVLELGSGPGHLAEQLLTHCKISRYVALDFSSTMHALASARLSAFADRVEFATRDFRQADWNAGLGSFDAVVTLQAAHETRHKRHLPALLAQARQTLRPDGLMLYCDHYAGPGKHPDLFWEVQAQAEVLRQTGFGKIEKLRDLGGMALYAARPA
jgi:SAM-dependent methyltransferase